MVGEQVDTFYKAALELVDSDDSAPDIRSDYHVLIMLLMCMILRAINYQRYVIVKFFYCKY